MIFISSSYRYLISVPCHNFNEYLHYDIEFHCCIHLSKQEADGENSAQIFKIMFMLKDDWRQTVRRLIVTIPFSGIFAVSNLQIVCP